MFKKVNASKILAGLVIIVAISCGKDDDQPSSAVTFNITAADVVKNLKDPYGETIFVNGVPPLTNWQPRFRLLLYHENGDLAANETRVVNSFNETVTFNQSLTHGKYHVFLSADMIEPSGEKHEPWELTEPEHLSTAKIYYRLRDNERSTIFEACAIRAGEGLLEVSDVRTVDVSLPPFGAWYTLIFNNVYSTNISAIVFTTDKFNGYVSLGERSTYYTKGSVAYIDGIETAPDHVGPGKYALFAYFMPINDITLSWSALDKSGNVISAQTGSVKFSAAEGEDKIINIDVISKTFNITPNSVPLKSRQAMDILPSTSLRAKQSSLFPQHSGQDGVLFLKNTK
jgi:hypothetical protein